MQMFAPLQAPQIARGLSPQTATCRGSYASAHHASWQVCEHSSCCTSSAPVLAYCATAPPVLHVMPASMGCVGHIPQTWSETCCRASGASINQAGKEFETQRHNIGWALCTHCRQEGDMRRSTPCARSALQAAASRPARPLWSARHPWPPPAHQAEPETEDPAFCFLPELSADDRECFKHSLQTPAL